MKNRIKISVLLAVVFVCGILTQTFAATAIQQIKATLRTDVKFMVNGENATLKDSKGKATYPIVYNGTTYIPAVEALNALKVPFEYDTKTQTMYFGSKAVLPTRLIDLKMSQGYNNCPINKTVDKKVLTVEAGDAIKETTTYKFGLYADKISFSENRVTFFLDNKYKKLTAKVYCKYSDNRTIELIISDKDKDIQLYQNKFTTGQMEDIEVDVSGIKRLNIQIKNQFESVSNTEKFLIIEPTLE